jgi:hypothetical protein
MRRCLWLMVLAAILCSACSKYGDLPNRPTPVGPTPPMAETPSCNYSTLTPNYAAELHVFEQYRWYQLMTPGASLKVFVSPVMALPQIAIDAAVRTGLESWSTMTDARVGAIQYTSSQPDADITVKFAAAGDVPLGFAGDEHSSLTGGRLSFAQIRYANNFFTDLCRDQAACNSLAQRVAAHEMGHALAFSSFGVYGDGHTLRMDSLMSGDFTLFTAPQPVDINTMLTAYGCPH